MSVPGVGAVSVRTSVEAAVAALRNGRMVLVVSAADGGYRGDLVVAAEHATAEAVNALMTLGRGLVHVAMPAAALDRLEIPPADPSATGPSRERFRMSVGLAGAGTGVRASERAKVVRALTDPASAPTDFTRPGHVFPLGCGAGGVLSVPEPPEAAAELAELAGTAPAAALCEVCAADGELAGLPELLELGRRHRLPVVTIDDLVTYRRRELARVRRCGTARIPLAAGEFRAYGFIDGLGREHIAFVYGHPVSTVTPLVRVHGECLSGDALGSLLCDCRTGLDRALDRIARAGHGVLVYLRSRGGFTHGIAQAASYETLSPAAHPLEEWDLRTAFDILDDLGLHEIRLLTDSARDTNEQARTPRQDSTPVPIPRSGTEPGRSWDAIADPVRILDLIALWDNEFRAPAATSPTSVSGGIGRAS
ncbi:3,4-dihydroxy-2-butanone-4-phosphate synthase [Nocardia blacklockiae]|uniref:3,4-dihydroxy-2-butanone-4-phosphate synthase n=1 Tax=Nocardia blacklockiae TaxID=480036 RepID=UPI001895BDBB|nr:3,4-dihydroxy-2-butanone-4-phosphate synthase [Nocardia blacklockiae]MBF6170030.1 3,4-dihydroxy-2-butanone-4-phosphate synthase [Nocardia blacklockiae]